MRQNGPVDIKRDMPETSRLRDELEQLRTALESALDENATLDEDRQRLLHRVTTLSRDLQDAHAHYRDAPPRIVAEPTEHRLGSAEEELRVAFEEMHVLTEELEASNTNLQVANQELDARVKQRTIELQHSNTALQEAEASLRSLTNLVPDLLWRTDAGGKANWFNQRWYEYTAQREEDGRGAGWLNAVHPADREQVQLAWEAAIRTGGRYESEMRIRSASGEYRWFIARAEQPFTPDGESLGWFGTSTDIHDHRLTLEALGQSERRFRTLVEGMAPLVWRATDGGKWTWCSPQWTEMTGQQQAETLGDGWLDAFHPDDRATARASWAVAQAQGRLEIKGRIFHRMEQRYRHCRTTALPVHDPHQDTAEWIGTSTDIEDMMHLQQQQEVLVHELQHRTQNLIGIVQALVMRTIKTSDTLADFRGRIADRLQALSRVQGLLSKRDTHERVTFDALLRAELGAHVDLDTNEGSQIVLHGPQGISLRSGTVQTFALALHELATNAVKYGALSQPGARLEIRWTVKNEAGGTWLCVHWRETGVAGVARSGDKPLGGGYGRELIERALPYQLGARSRYDLTPSGVDCTIELPVPEIDAIREVAHD